MRTLRTKKVLMLLTSNSQKMALHILSPEKPKKVQEIVGFSRIVINVCVPEIDLFARRSNAKCYDKYISWRVDPYAYSTYGCSYNELVRMVLYDFPLFFADKLVGTVPNILDFLTKL